MVGSGYTGLCAAIETARGGRSTVVLDAEDAGWGCSTRNGGQVSTSFKPSFEELAAQHGAERALAILKEGHTALDWIDQFIAAEKIDCGFARVGRFHAAHNPKQYEMLARRLQNQPKGLEVECHMVPRGEQPDGPASIQEGHDGGTTLGKRYGLADDPIEVLVTKAGQGALSMSGRLLETKDPKPLPSSE